MLRRRPGLAVSLIAAALVALLAGSGGAPAGAQGRKSFRWTTSPLGSYDYTIASLMARPAEQALGREYTVTVQPYTSATVAMKAVMDGNGELAYTADIAMAQLRERTGGFKDYTPRTRELVHTWYAYPVESMLAVPAATASQFRCWRDFSGKPVFYTTAGFMNWLNWRRIYDALGYEFKHVQIDVTANAAALQAGTIVGSAAYTTAGRSLAAYWKETELVMDLRIVNPCPDEVARLRAAGLAVVEVDPRPAFTKAVGPSPLVGVRILLGYNATTVIPEGLVYRMLAAFYRHRESLARQEPGLAPLARDFVGLQVQGIEANPGIPVHPGLVRFLKEHRAWNDGWKVAAVNSATVRSLARLAPADLRDRIDSHRRASATSVRPGPAGRRPGISQSRGF